MPFSEWLRKLLDQIESQERELRRLKERSAELIGAPSEDRRKADIPVAVDRRKKKHSDPQRVALPSPL